MSSRYGKEVCDREDILDCGDNGTIYLIITLVRMVIHREKWSPHTKYNFKWH